MSVHKEKSATPLKAPILPDIVLQHIQQAAFLWAQRDVLLAEDLPDNDIVAGVDRRLEIDLDGVRVAGHATWPLILAAYDEFPQKGELFLVSWAAIEFADTERVGQAIELGRISGDGVRGLIGALAWHKPAAISSLVRDWIDAHDEFKRFLAVSACVEHGVDPMQRLAGLLRDPEPRVRAVGLRLAGKLKRTALFNDLRGGLDDREESVRFWAAWALGELGSGDLATPELRKVATGGGDHALTALRSAVKAAPDNDIRAWMGALLRSSETAPLAVRGAGMMGDRAILPWLVVQMSNPALAVAAGASLLELFPEARQADDLFTLDPVRAGRTFEEHFGDDSVRLPLADKVKEWALSKGFYAQAR
ncbi:HEAT repeat domain-containing protein [Mesorhizobium sangaii]|uniref:Uncharacterized protein (TIGR02270 family) n=1 Tax=Mesorhizobium sangaii TaxID=505389 RepID=A0A841NZX2_9HYPH|nr:HEAT repeat domain-containing protein [Mesorhizobium sangaii]MBB6408624.1 uncharacterized protein (TIGR02270 family) [Mesorhizobium sangaii]